LSKSAEIVMTSENRKGRNLIIALVLAAVAVVGYTAFYFRVKYGPF
jgi:hypothetical protein